jgi:ABC-type transporter Mla MlaB component
MNFFARLFKKKKEPLPPFIRDVSDFGHVKIIRFKGSLEKPVIPDLTAFFEASKLGKGPGHLDKSVLLDFKKVGHVESATIAALLQILTALRKKGQRLALMNVPTLMSDTLDILKLKHAFIILESEKRAYEEILHWSKEWE